MRLGQPSRTALAAATHRAAHQILEQGRIFRDPLALRILGQDPEIVAREAQEHRERRRMRLFIAVRTRFAEDSLAKAVENGVRQLVVLGAGLDTYAYRNPFGDRLRVFEVDHPATQAWKRQQLAFAAISVPNTLTFAPIDFEREILAQQLAAVGFDLTQQTFFMWLGVVPYLTEDAVWSTLRFIARSPNGAHVVFDYSDPPDSLSPELRTSHDERAQRVESIGEAWLCYFKPETLRAGLSELGFRDIQDLGPPQISARYFPNRDGSPPDRGGHIVLAGTI
jgi:methyltransferase (TIGR00027 family)